MAKEVTATVKLQCPAGAATPAPPVGPALGQHGINIGQFVKQFNDETRSQAGLIIPVVISVYSDRTFSFILKTPPVPVLIKQILGLKSGSPVPNKTKVGKLTMEQVATIARQKIVDTNAGSHEACMRSVMGTARSMGVDIEG